MWNPFKTKELPVIELDYKPMLSSLNEKGLINIQEQFKGEVDQTKVRFPSELGEEHPFNFKQLEDLYKKFGFFTAVVDKYIDFVVGPGFYIKCDKEKPKKIIEDFMQDVNFDTLLRQWTKEALIKGNGFIEIGGDKDKGVKGLKVLSANNMYVVRDKYGKIEGYNQYRGGFKGFNLDRLVKGKKVISFKPEQIAHVPFNIIGDCGYGLGIGYPAMQLIDNMLRMSHDVHWLMERKANSPLHAKLGKVDGNIKIIPKAADVQAYGKKMEVMNKKTNWATDDLVDLKVVDFGKIGDKFSSLLEHDLNMLIYAFQIPGVILGMSNINMGIAKVEMESFQRRIQSIQAEIEKIIEEKIFKRVLNANGFDVHVEFEWGTPSVLQMEGRMEMMSELIKSPTTSGAMKMMLEDEMVNLFKLDEDEWEKVKLEQEQKEEEERKRLEARPQPIVPGQNAKFPKPVQPKKEQPKQSGTQSMGSATLNDIMDMLKEKGKKITKIPNLVRDKNRTSLLPSLNISQDSIIEKSKEEITNIVKRKEENKNYEYEKECPHCTEQFSEVNDISEWLGFNYKKYLKHIATVLQAYEFSQIKAINEIELEAGMFTEVQVEELRKVLDKGFKKGQGLKDMAKEVDNNVKPKDLYRMTSEGEIKIGASGFPILSKSADKRAISIVRSEVTRMANAGAVEFYKTEDIKQVTWVASFGDRTCPDCEALNGQIYEINKHPDIPFHPMCRCTLSPVVELK